MEHFSSYDCNSYRAQKDILGCNRRRKSEDGKRISLTIPLVKKLIELNLLPIANKYWEGKLKKNPERRLKRIYVDYWALSLKD